MVLHSPDRLPPLPDPTPQRRTSRYRYAVPVVGLAAGLLLTTASVTSRGTELRGAREQLPDLIVAEQGRVAALEQQAASLRGDVEARTRARAGADGRVTAAADAAARLAGPSGLEPVTGPGLEVVLDDAPPAARDRPPPAGLPEPTPDDLVVHQQDIQGVVNALWAGGAEAMTLMGQRVIVTTAVRCVGNTLLLHGAVYSPPFRLQAVGDPLRLRAALDDSSSVRVFRQYVDAYGLVLGSTAATALSLPAYTGAVELGSRPAG
ncbi:MAG: hypothetical protein QOG60_2232 [Frankiaceae bacterium]|nr:hypothetical protein [Frankiaceae bacterium]